MANLVSRVKTWVFKEILTSAALNAEFDNILNNLLADKINDYSDSVAEMQIQTDPGSQGSESQATSVAGEIERLRFEISRIIGKTYHYDSPSIDLEQVNSEVQLGTTRIVSGRIRSTSSYPIHLVPNGSAATVTLKGVTTNFVYFVSGTSYTISSDVTATLLTTAPSSNNTALINDAYLGSQTAEVEILAGQNGRSLHIDTAGSEIVSLVGTRAGFKVNDGVTDTYFTAYIKSTTELTQIKLGNYFDSADAPYDPLLLANNDTITLMKLTWVFAKSDLTLDVTYNEPKYAPSAPSVPTVGDYWYDTLNELWKDYDGAAWNTALVIPVGECMQDATNTVAATSYLPYVSGNSRLQELTLNYLSATEVTAANNPGTAIVYNKTLTFTDKITIDITTDLRSGESEANNTYYFVYAKEDGTFVISGIPPVMQSGELKGLYFPSDTWRCIGSFFNVSNDISSVSIISMIDSEERKFKNSFISSASLSVYQDFHTGYGETLKRTTTSSSATTTTEVVVTNSDISVISAGNPIKLNIGNVMTDPSGSSAFTGNIGVAFSSGTTGRADIHIYRDTDPTFGSETRISLTYIQLSNADVSTNRAPVNISFIDSQIQAHVRCYYRIKIALGSGTGTAFITSCSFDAYEM